MDKNKATIEYLLTCEAIRKSPLYFNLSQGKAGSKLFVTQGEDKNIEEPYIDGSVKKRYSLTVISYCSMSTTPIAKTRGKSDKNMEDYADVQSLMDWIQSQKSENSFPNFGGECIIEDMDTTSSNPIIDMIDATQTPPVAKYSFTMRVEYIDNSEVLWK